MPAECVAYKTVHRAAGSLFPVLTTEAQRLLFSLTEAQVAEYRARGFIKGPRVLDDHQIAVLAEALERVRTGDHPRLNELYEIDEAYTRAPGENVFHFLGAWMIEEAFHDVLFHPAVAVPVSQLLGCSKVRFWHDQVFYKPARHPGVVAWHQDYAYWTRSVPARHLTVWIGLDDSTRENGCVHFVPGSHRWNLLPKGALLEDMEAIKQRLTREQVAYFMPEPMILRAGECSFHHCMTLHGSYGNTSDRPRRAVVINYMHPDSRSADGTNPLLLHTPIIPEGEIIQGENYPIVYDSSLRLA
ncbi:MAG: phytanoyl-CoA dioxygenase family protein [Candidatus Hydrogenedentes bacterium]|nr:phytanoyl-CoA dioxygenase family protein [Candidatus Hydrogenedentota bacterium]